MIHTPIRGETESTRCKYPKINFKDRVDEPNWFDRRIEKIIRPSNISDF